MRPWTLDPLNRLSETQGPEHQVAAEWKHFSSRGRISHLFMIEGNPVLDEEGFQDYVIRLLCHALIDRVPEQALPELLDEIENIYRYYLTAPPARALQQPSRVLQVKIGRRFERPTFPLSEE